ncbi:MAG: CbiX/SirB N-terminal domain-containing protein [Candidatus Tectomicrobia bacterium]|uniref:CbiX/SirB N-terminal domain-containing protein n=1 Tax=Tectimicrobiota bacterium TaxID=2528274 RepID=A0A932HYW4_UNCTE|nr:CbiX/SirB N-terminal domain-containing protein [Candidatus Tectomicrobia bacterium]
MNPSEPRLAVLLLGHGSKAEGANEAMHRVEADLRAQHPGWIVASAFLEINHPSIPEGIDLCARRGAERIILLPYFLHLGNHVAQDLPRLMAEGQARHPGLEITLGPHLGYHPKLAEIAEERLREAMEGVHAKR